jgi:hypothetical protein
MIQVLNDIVNWSISMSPNSIFIYYFLAKCKCSFPWYKNIPTVQTYVFLARGYCIGGRGVLDPSIVLDFVHYASPVNCASSYTSGKQTQNLLFTLHRAVKIEMGSVKINCKVK